MERLPFFKKFDRGWPVSDLVSQYLLNVKARHKRDIKLEEETKRYLTRSDSGDDGEEETSLRVVSIVLNAYILFIVIIFQDSSDNGHKSTEEQHRLRKV